MSDSGHGGLDGLEEAAETCFLEREWEREERDERVRQMPSLYRRAKKLKVGVNIECPVCGRVFRKKSYQQAFCSNKGRGNCKDTYWNMVDENRSFRAQMFNRR